MKKLNKFEHKGWIKFDFDHSVARWAKVANSKITSKLKNKEIFESNLKSCKTCQSNGAYESYYSMYGFKGTYDDCKGITNETDCTNKSKDLGGYGYPSNVCKWE